MSNQAASREVKRAIVADTEADTLTGSSGSDWFVKSSSDKVTDNAKADKDAVTSV